MPSAGYKLAACLCMLLDHTALTFWGMLDPVYQTSFRLIGRMGFPIFAFFIANGCRHTKNRLRYLLRLLLLGLLSQAPYRLALGIPGPDALFTLAAGALCIFLWEYALMGPKTQRAGRASLYLRGAAAFCTGAVLLAGYLWRGVFLDYGWLGPALILLAYFLEKRSAFLCMSLALSLYYQPFSIYGVFSLLFALAGLWALWWYNGREGIKGKWTKNAFYLFYPAHLTVLAILRYFPLL